MNHYVQSFRKGQNNREIYVSGLSDIWTLQIDDLPAKIENDHKGVIPGTKVEGGQRKILPLVAVNFFLEFREFSKLKVIF